MVGVPVGEEVDKRIACARLRAGIGGGVVVFDHIRAIHIGQGCLDELEGRGQNHVESKGCEAGHDRAREGGVGLVALSDDITPDYFQTGTKTNHTEASD